MDIDNTSKRGYATSLKAILLQPLATFILAIIFAILLHNTLIRYLDVYHTVLELSCVFISMSVFFSIWFTYYKNSVTYNILGLGYLAVAVFDVLHTFFHLKLDLNANSYFDLSTRYWILGRITEAVILLLSVRSVRTKLNKWLALVITLTISIGTALFVDYYHNYLPVLLTQQGVTPLKIGLECAVILILAFTLYLLKDKVADRAGFTYKYIFIAILLAIPSEICFTLYITVNSTIWTIGHVLKIAAYFYLFKGIFISTVTYPYEKLEDEHIRLDEAFKALKEEQQKVIQQEKLALLGQMGAGIVHETRNYLTTIKGRCQLIELQSQDDKIKEHTAKINSNVDEVNEIMSEFLFLSKPKNAEMEEVSLYDIFRSIKVMIETSSMVKGVNIEFSLSREERYLLCDESQIKQVILNICKNAIEAMNDIKEARLKVDTGYNEITNEMYIRVSDNGKGISEDDLNKIGTAFYTTKKSGTGLGLNICYRIIKQHNGDIKVKSEVGKGTTFIVSLPCINDLQDELEATIDA